MVERRVAFRPLLRLPLTHLLHTEEMATAACTSASGEDREIGLDVDGACVLVAHVHDGAGGGSRDGERSGTQRRSIEVALERRFPAEPSDPELVRGDSSCNSLATARVPMPLERVAALEAVATAAVLQPSKKLALLR